jgi:hypothetical protein
MIGRVPSSAVSDLHPACWLACLARPLIGVKERRTAGATARGRRTAPHHAQASPGLGRPSGAGRADPAPAQKAAGAPAGHAGHRPAVAPPPGQKEMDLPEPHRTTARQPRDRRTDRAPRHRKSLLGVSADPRRDVQARPPGRRLHDPPDPQGPGGSLRRRNGTPTRRGGSSCIRKPRRCSPSASFTWTARCPFSAGTASS